MDGKKLGPGNLAADTGAPLELNAATVVRPRIANSMLVASA
jgi:hypothetical protein